MQTIVNDAKRRILSVLQDSENVENAKKIADRVNRELKYYAQRDSQALESTLGLIGDEQGAALEEKIKESKDKLHQLAAKSMVSLNDFITSGIAES